VILVGWGRERGFAACSRILCERLHRLVRKSTYAILSFFEQIQYVDVRFNTDRVSDRFRSVNIRMYEKLIHSKETMN
jgi:hypothetical protein